MSKREKMDMATRRQIVVDVLAQAALDLKLGNLPKKPALKGPLRKTAWVELSESQVDPTTDQPGKSHPSTATEALSAPGGAVEPTHAALE